MLFSNKYQSSCKSNMSFTHRCRVGWVLWCKWCYCWQPRPVHRFHQSLLRRDDAFHWTQIQIIGAGGNREGGLWWLHSVGGGSWGSRLTVKKRRLSSYPRSTVMSQLINSHSNIKMSFIQKHKTRTHVMPSTILLWNSIIFILTFSYGGPMRVCQVIFTGFIHILTSGFP